MSMRYMDYGWIQQSNIANTEHKGNLYNARTNYRKKKGNNPESNLPFTREQMGE